MKLLNSNGYRPVKTNIDQPEFRDIGYSFFAFPILYSYQLLTSIFRILFAVAVFFQLINIKILISQLINLLF